MGSGSFGRNRDDLNIQQKTASEGADIETVMADNEELDPPSLQDISNVFATLDLLSRSSSDSAKYKGAWHKARVIHSSFFICWVMSRLLQ